MSRVVWVTGASSGIGAAIARALGKRGDAVAVGARRQDRLESVAAEIDALGGRGFAHGLDVTQPDSIDAFADAAESALGPPDVVVSNAGRAGLDLLEECSAETLRDEVTLNLLGPLYLARRVVPGMRARGRGDLVFVTSETAVRPRPMQVPYSASKAGLEAAARALGMELEGSGVRSLIVRVGPTGDTEFARDVEHPKLHRALRAWKYWGQQRHLHWMGSAVVADAVDRLLQMPAEAGVPAEIEIMPGARFDPPWDE